MKKEVKIAIIVVLVALLVGAAALYVKAARRPIISPLPEGNGSKTGTVETESTQLNVRVSAGEADGLTNKSTAIDCLNKGDKVEITEISENQKWGYVPAKGGWVSLNYIKFD